MGGKYNPREWATLTCSICSKEVLRRAAAQKYCEPCAAKSRAEINSVSHRRVRGRHTHIAATARGAVVAESVRRDVEWHAGTEPNLATCVRFSLPFSSAFSKNRMYSLTKDKDGVVVRKEARKAKDAIAWSTRLSIQNTRFYHGKVWLDILVQKIAENADAVNVVDIVCDGVKVGLGIDDRWFSIRRLDWEIVKENPRIYIGIGQEITEDHRLCRFCGQARISAMFVTQRMCKICYNDGVVDQD